MILLGTGHSEDIILLVFLLLFALIALLISKRRLCKVLAKVNKLILPSMLHKDLNTLKMFDKLVISYRYWVTKNSL